MLACPKLWLTLAHAPHADCLREVNATLAQNKPFCLAFDPVRGGASLPDIEAECNADLQLSIFGPPDAKRDVIIWHRFKDFQIVSIKLMTEQLLRGCPQETYLEDLRLFVPGELPRQRLTLRRRPVVFASPNNPGALTVAKDIASAMGGRIDVTSDASEAPTITHFLLLLNDRTYLDTAGKTFAEELRSARAAGVKVLTVHENDQERGGCEFCMFFDGRTPQDLVEGGIYDALAVALYSGQFWPVSAALAAKGLGAITAAGSRRSFTTASATRTGVISGEWGSGRITTRLMAMGRQTRVQPFAVPNPLLQQSLAGSSSRAGSISTASGQRGTGESAGVGGRRPQFAISSEVNALISQDDPPPSATTDRNEAALANRLAKARRKMSILHGWCDDGARATKDRPGRATYRGSSDRRTSGRPPSSTNDVSTVHSSQPFVQPCETAAAKAAASKMAAMGLFSPAGVAGGPAGPAWARGEVETPQGAMRTATGYAVAVYTPEQNARLEQQARAAAGGGAPASGPRVAAGVTGPTAAAATVAAPGAPTLGRRASPGSLLAVGTTLSHPKEAPPRPGPTAVRV